MTFTTKLLAGAAGLAALGGAVPAAAQYYANPYGYQANPYGYQANPYANAYGYGRAYGAVNTNAAAQQCSAAVQQRLYNRQSIGGIIGAVLGANTSGRVLSVTQAYPRSDGTVRVRGLASSGRMASNGYGPYGMGAYGALGYNTANAADLSFRCDVDMRGYVRNVDINRRY